MSIKKLNIKIKIIRSSPFSNTNASMAYTSGCGFLPFLSYLLLKYSIICCAISSPFIQFSWFSLCSFSDDYSPTRYWTMLLQDLVPCLGYSFLIVWFILNLKKMSSLLHTRDSEPVVQLTATHPRLPVFQGVHQHLPCSPFRGPTAFFCTAWPMQHNIQQGWLQTGQAPSKVQKWDPI